MGDSHGEQEKTGVDGDQRISALDERLSKLEAADERTLGRLALHRTPRRRR